MIIILAALLAVAVILLCATYVQKGSLAGRLAATMELKIQAEQTAARGERKIDELTEQVQHLTADNATLRERNIAAVEESRRASAAAEEHFRNLADDIFRSQSARFRETSEQRLGEILEPLKSNLADFRKSVADAVNQEARERFSLRRELQGLIELNKSIGVEAQELTKALKGDSKVQGDWGEMILERLLEMSGLKEGVHFLTQPTRNTDGSRITSADGGLLRPDVVVLYPDDRCVVVDSKVSLTAYTDLVNATDEAQRKGAEKRHLASARSHIAELERKNYQDLIGEKKLDFVLMFVPNEGAFMSLMHIEPLLWEEAFAKRVLLTSPTHLISVLRMLAQLWRQDASRRNVAEIARLSGTMIDKITNFLTDMEAVEHSITASLTAVQRARSRLAEGNGNVLVTARKIVGLGARVSKLPQFNRLATPNDEKSLEESDS